jgi:hypothetical protein
VCIAPLRGAYIPSLFTYTISKHNINIQYLPFSNHKDTTNDVLAKKHLADILDRTKPSGNRLRVSILDTAIGGQGINHIADIISAYSTSANKTIDMTAHLLVAKGNYNSYYIYKAKNKSLRNCKIRIRLHEVNSLIVEDWDPAIGIQILNKDGKFTLKPSINEGKFIFKNQFRNNADRKRGYIKRYAILYLKLYQRRDTNKP